MQVFDTDELGAFSEESFEKVNLVQTDDMFLDCYCLLPGQAQAVHTHAESDKLYLVLEGTATVTVDDEERDLEPGQLVFVDRGSSHGVRNDGEEPVRTLVMMTPLPAADGGHHHDHVEVAPRSLAVYTVSSTRTTEDDPSGASIRSLATANGHEIDRYRVIPDDAAPIRAAVRDAVEAVDAVILSGGTGITPDDVTIEAVEPLFDKELPGFGEHLRRLSVDEVGSAVIMTRTTAGVVDGTPVFALPGSTNAVELAMGNIVLPELDHLIDLATR